MESDIVPENLDSKLLGLPPIEDMEEIISEFENSGMANESSIFNETELDFECDSVEEEITNSIDSNSSIHEEALVNASFDILNENEVASILESEISNHSFEDVKINEEIKSETIERNINQIKEESTSIILPNALPLHCPLNEENIEECILPDVKQYPQKSFEHNSVDNYNEKKQFIFSSIQNNTKSLLNHNGFQKDNDRNTSKVTLIKLSKKNDTSIINNDITLNDINTKVEESLNVSNNTLPNYLKEVNGSQEETEIKNIESKNSLSIPDDSLSKKYKHKNVSINYYDKVNIPHKIEEKSCSKQDTVVKEVAQILVDMEGTLQNMVSDAENINPTNIKSESSVKREKASSFVIQDEKESITKNSVPTDISINSNRDNVVNFSIKEEILVKEKKFEVFEVSIPLIGTNKFEKESDKPFMGRYDLAEKRNKIRAEQQKNNTDFQNSNVDHQEWKRQRESRSPKQIEQQERTKFNTAKRLARVFMKFAINVLQEYQPMHEKPNEEIIIRCLKYFSYAPVSRLSLLHAPHFVLAVILVRGDSKRSTQLKRLANLCYEKCHCLFGIPVGYNFQTVFMSEVKKHNPEMLEEINEIMLEYGNWNSPDFDKNIAVGSKENDIKHER